MLNYSLVQARIFPSLVNSFAFHFTGREMFRMYEQNQSAMGEGDFSGLGSSSLLLSSGSPAK